MPIQHLKVLRSGENEKQLELAEQDNLSPWREDKLLSLVGQSVARLEGVEKVTGRARYAYDIQLPGQLYAAVLRSPYPHARIKRIVTDAAERLPGVHGVLSSANAPPISWYQTSRLFDTTVRFVGDEVAAVAAVSEEIAADALRLIEVEYQQLPFVVELESASQKSAATVHEDAADNCAGDGEIYQRGDLEAGLGQAEVIIDQVYTTQTAVHNSLEPHGCTAVWEGERLTLWESTQGIFEVREQVAEKLGLPEHHVRVIKQHMGGGFGAKQIAWKHSVIAALLAKASTRPVQLMLDRSAENLAAGNRNATRQRVRLGARRDGTLTAIGADIQIAVGAYQIGGESSMVAGSFQRLYRCPNVRTEQVGIYTNTGPSVAFRAPGYVEGAFALESALDELARRLAIDPLELRLRNYAEREQKKDKPFTSPEALRRCYQQASASFGWQRRDRSPAQPNGKERKRRGVGLAAHDWVGGGGHPPAYAWVKLNADGTLEVVTGTQDIGTGARTGLAQVAAEEFGLPLGRIALHLGDTAYGAYAPTSAGSATQASLGPAIRAACANAKRQLLIAAAELLRENDPQQLRVRDGTVYRQRRPADSLTIAEIASRIAPQMIQGHGARGPNPEDKVIRTCGVQLAEVEVDTETGEITVLRLTAAHDCGRIVNPRLVDSQVIGGITQGIGFALTEERIIDPASGVVLNANLEEYKLPSVAEIPPIDHVGMDLPDLEANPTGAKGVGESPIIPTAAAIANAVFDAVGIRLRHTPLSRQQVLKALAGQRQEQQP